MTLKQKVFPCNKTFQTSLTGSKREPSCVKMEFLSAGVLNPIEQHPQLFLPSPALWPSFRNPLFFKVHYSNLLLHLFAPADTQVFPSWWHVYVPKCSPCELSHVHLPHGKVEQIRKSFNFRLPVSLELRSTPHPPNPAWDLSETSSYRPRGDSKFRKCLHIGWYSWHTYTHTHTTDRPSTSCPSDDRQSSARSHPRTTEGVLPAAIPYPNNKRKLVTLSHFEYIFEQPAQIIHCQTECGTVPPPALSQDLFGKLG